MRRCLLLFLAAPLWLLAQEHNVPAGSSGNRFVLAVQNATLEALHDVRVAVLSSPSWVQFKTPQVVIETIPASTWREAVFEFQVLQTANDQAAAVMLAITDERGELLSRREIKLRAITLPQKIELASPYPNPANPGANIQYALHASAAVQLEIYNVLGQRVRTLVAGEKPAGRFEVLWDGRDERDQPVPSGTYFVRLQAKEKSNNQETRLSAKIIISK